MWMKSLLKKKMAEGSRPRLHCYTLYVEEGYMVMQWCITVETGFQTWASPCRICGGLSGTGRVVSSNTSVFSPSVSLHNLNIWQSLNIKLKKRDVGKNNMAYKVVICPPWGLCLHMPWSVVSRIWSVGAHFFRCWDTHKSCRQINLLDDIFFNIILT